MAAKKVNQQYRTKLKGAWMDFSSHYDLTDIDKNKNEMPKKLRLVFEHGFKAGFDANNRSTKK